MPILMLFLLSLLAYLTVAAQPLSLDNALVKPILAVNQPLVEVQVYTASHVKSMPSVSTAQQWTQTKEQLRQQLLNDVVLRREGRKWAEAKTRVDWLDVLPGRAIASNASVTRSSLACGFPRCCMSPKNSPARFP